ncbi:MAG: AAA family ATPase [Candidatus Sumerlaeota bacterium]|nr:AAA family ATPase [Candidatus Sumerlaeota bacterium]
MTHPVFLRRVVLKNYKSIAKCSVALNPLNFLVGPNGAGKSNFLEALRLVADALNTSLDHALRERGGIQEVRRRSSGHPTHFGIRLEFTLRDDVQGHYAFRVGAKEKGGFEVQEEECRIEPDWGSASFFKVESGEVKDSSAQILPPAADDRLYLVAAAGLPEFRPLYDALSHMGFYNLSPDAIRELQPPDAGETLSRDGGNLASVLSLMERENKEARNRVVEFLSVVVPGIVGIETKHIAKKETIEFRQKVGGSASPWRFMAENMSDGTLRALGVLAALFQSANGGAKRVPLVGIEEPEVAVHPGAAGVLRDALRVASANTQVLVTSHSPDLLDDKSIGDECILGVSSINGETKIGRLNDAERSLIRDRLFTAGELLRSSELGPNIEQINQIPARQLELFGEASRE